jgi:hypothetical protein
MLLQAATELMSGHERPRVLARLALAALQMGTNLLIVLPGSSSTGGSKGGFGSQPTLTWDDLAAIKNEVAIVKAVVPSLRSNQSLVSDQLNWTTSVTGTTRPSTSTSATGPCPTAPSSRSRTSTPGTR